MLKLAYLAPTVLEKLLIARIAPRVHSQFIKGDDGRWQGHQLPQIF
jgi:hypothetical protein